MAGAGTPPIAPITRGKSDIQDAEPETIPNFLRNACHSAPDVNALCYKHSKDGPLYSITYAEYWKMIYDVSKSLYKLGLRSGRAVCIFGSNSVQWFVSSLGAIFAGGRSAGIYTKSGTNECYHILKNSNCNIVMVENEDNLKKIIKIRDHLPYLKAIVQWKGAPSEYYPFTYTWEKFMEAGKDVQNSVIDNIISRQQPYECAVLVYTSGTTGYPKGVMLSHDNITWVTKALVDTQIKCKLQYGGKERSLSYLPLAHISGMIADMYLPICIHSTVYFAPPGALKGSLVDSLKEVKPTFFFGVPRIWEEIKNKIERQFSGIEQRSKFFEKMKRKLISLRVQWKLGLHNCKYVLVGADPIHPETLEFFKSLNIPILEVYGLSECTGIQSLNFNSSAQLRPESCGKALNGVEIKICGLCHVHGPDEILIHGRHVFIGYHGMEEETRYVKDSEGWLHTGDMGYLDKDGFLYISGRIKELIATAGGERVWPIYVEKWIKTEVPFLSNVMVVGNRRAYLTCLVTLKCIINSDTGEATDDLQPQVVKRFKELGSKCTTVSQVRGTHDHEAVKQAITKGIDKYNSVPNTIPVRRFRILQTDFTIFGGELGPTMKLKREVVMEKYKEEIDDMYDKHSTTV